MGIENELQESMKTAMRAKDKRTLDVLRMVKSKALEKKTSAGYHGGELTEQDWLDIVAAYVKSLQKSLPEFEKAGEQGREQVEQLQWEIQYLGRWLPSKMGEPETRAAVEAVIAEMGARDPKQVGQVMGKLMKAHKDRVDANVARKIAEEHLTRLAAGS